MAIQNTIPAAISVLEQQGVNIDGTPRFVVSRTWLAWFKTLSNGAVIGPTSSGILAWNSSTLTASARTLTSTSAGLVITNGTGVSGNPSFALSTQLQAVSDLASNGLITRTASGTVSARTVTAGNAITVTNGDGVSGNPTVAFSGNYLAFQGTSSAQSISNGSTVTLTLTAQTDNKSGLSSNAYTMPTLTGTQYFTMSGHVGFKTSLALNATFTLSIYKNGSQIAYTAITQSEFVAGDDTVLTLPQFVIPAVTGDVFTLRVSHSDSAARTTTTQSFSIFNSAYS